MLVNTKYLTILSGNPRGGEATWNSLYKNVLEPLNSDLAICTGSKWIINQSFLKVAKFKWIFEEPSNWEQYYESNFDGKWKEYFFKGIDTGLYSSGMIHFALKDIILKTLEKEGGAAGLKALAKASKTSKKDLEKDLDDMSGVKQHKHGDYISTPLTEVKDHIFELVTEKLCKKGKAYIAKRKRAGEKSSAYLSGRAVKVCKGQMKG